MKNIKFNYIDYNSRENKLFDAVKTYTDSENLIVLEDTFSESTFFSYINKNNLRIRDNFISLDNFFNNIFFNEKNILKDIKRYFTFYKCLNPEIKEKLNITNYFDCIETANSFFEYFSYDLDIYEILKDNLSTWQDEKFKIFLEIKKNMDIFLDEANYIPFDWLNKKENLNLYFLKKYKKIIFFDIVDFPENFSFILKELQKNNFEIEIVLQMKKGDFNEKYFKIEKISLPDKKIEIGLLEYKNDFELFANIKVNPELKSNIFYSPMLLNNFEDKYSIFSKSSKYLFNDTKLYKVIEAHINLYEAIDFNKNNSLNLYRLKDNIFCPEFMEFYGLDNEDIKIFDKILINDYIYLTVDLLESDFFNYYFKNNLNLQEKLKLIINNTLKINNIKNISDLNKYFKTTFFSTDEDIIFFMENKFSLIFDKFYEIIGLLNSNENTYFFNKFSIFFEKNIGKNIITLFFNYLNNLTLYADKLDDEEKNYLKDLYNIKFQLENSKTVSLLNMDNLSLPKIKKNNLFTEQQKLKLGIKTYENSLLVEKYRFFQNVVCLDKVNICSIVDLDNNIDYSPFIYELINKYSYKKIENVDLKLFIEEFYKQNSFYENFDLEEKNIVEIDKKYRAFKKEKSDFKKNELRIGAYDYNLLMKNETFFFLKNICPLSDEEEIEEINGISLKTLGNILHKTMENIFKYSWKGILKSTDNLLIEKTIIENELKKVIYKENLKIETFLNNYMEEILINKFTNNIDKFFHKIYEEIKDDKILRIQSEKKSEEKEIEEPFIKGIINVFLAGRADLIIETNRARYIIDFKSSSSLDKEKKEQLNFYAVMLYGNNKSSLPVYSFIYNLWEDNYSKELEISKFRIDNLEELKENMKNNIIEFLNKEYYELPSKKLLKENDFDFNNFHKYKNFLRGI